MTQYMRGELMSGFLFRGFHFLKKSDVNPPLVADRSAPYLRTNVEAQNGPPPADQYRHFPNAPPCDLTVPLLQYASLRGNYARRRSLVPPCPVCCPVTYHCGLFEGHGTVWNLSLLGWRFSGGLPLRVGEVCSLTVTLPPYHLVYVAAAIVRWVRQEEYGVETLVIDEGSRDELDHYLEAVQLY